MPPATESCGGILAKRAAKPRPRGPQEGLDADVDLVGVFVVGPRLACVLLDGVDNGGDGEEVERALGDVGVEFAHGDLAGVGDDRAAVAAEGRADDAEVVEEDVGDGAGEGGRRPGSRP